MAKKTKKKEEETKKVVAKCDNPNEAVANCDHPDEVIANSFLESYLCIQTVNCKPAPKRLRIF